MLDSYPLGKRISLLLGFSPFVLLRSLSGIPYFLGSLLKYRRLNRDAAFKISLRDLFPILSDRHDSAGSGRGHYFHQDLWAARKIYARHPARHVDVGSRVDGFIAHVLVFMPVAIIDIRPLSTDVSGLSFIRDDATALRQLSDDSVESLSSLHAAEHFGLGRYSDPIDPTACFQFMKSLQRVLAPSGVLYFSVPIGRERVEFNAHRVFSPATVLATFAALELISFSYIDDHGNLRENQPVSAAAGVRIRVWAVRVSEDSAGMSVA